MMNLSFGWTWPAFVMRKKFVTRRDWKEKHAERFKKGVRFAAYDRSPRFRGQKIGEGTLLTDPFLEPLSKMPDSDYFDEGFEFLCQNPSLIPKSLPYDVTREGFKEWRVSGGILYVVRFEIDCVTQEAAAMVERILQQSLLPISTRKREGN
jgi:hypothetical protein